MPACFSLKPNQTNPDSYTSRENDKFYPIPRTVKLHRCPFLQAALCRPLKALTLNILLMEGKWSWLTAGSLATEPRLMTHISFWASQKRFNTCTSSTFQGWTQPPTALFGSAEEGVDMKLIWLKIMMTNWCDAQRQRAVYEKGEEDCIQSTNSEYYCLYNVCWLWLVTLVMLLLNSIIW